MIEMQKLMPNFHNLIEKKRNLKNRIKSHPIFGIFSLPIFILYKSRIFLYTIFQKGRKNILKRDLIFLIPSTTSLPVVNSILKLLNEQKISYLNISYPLWKTKDCIPINAFLTSSNIPDIIESLKIIPKEMKGLKRKNIPLLIFLYDVSLNYLILKYSLNKLDYRLFVSLSATADIISILTAQIVKEQRRKSLYIPHGFITFRSYDKFPLEKDLDYYILFSKFQYSLISKRVNGKCFIIDNPLIQYEKKVKGNKNQICIATTGYNPEWIIYLSKLLIKKNWKIVIKPHPNESKKNLKLLTNLPSSLKHLTISYNLEQAIDSSEFFITKYSTTLFNALTKRKKVILFIQDKKIKKLLKPLPLKIVKKIEDIPEAIETFKRYEWSKKEITYLKYLIGISQNKYPELKLVKLIEKILGNTV